MAIFLGALAAVFFGVADYAGGSATRRLPVAFVLCLSHTIGLFLVVLSIPAWDSPFVWAPSIWGAVAGLVGGCGITLFYRALARGPMAAVTPITAVLSSLVPVLWSVILGESLGPLMWCGVLVAILAVGLVSISNEGSSGSISWATLLDSVGAGLLFGVVFILLDTLSGDDAPWPIVGARLTTGLTLLLVMLATGQIKQPLALIKKDRLLLALVATAGVLDTSANLAFLLASDLENLAIVSVIAGMYPVATVALARFVDNERLRRVQVVGIILILLATILLFGGE